MKRAVFSILLVFLPFLAFSAEFSISAGGGGLLGYTFTRYTLKGASTESQQKMDRFNFGGFLFFDATYAELSVLIHGGKNTYMEKMALGASVLANESGSGKETNLGIMLLGKYPFKISEKIILFPLLGIEYNIALVQKRKPEGDSEYNRSKGKGVSSTDIDKNGENYPLSAWNAFYIDAGAGMDFMLTDFLFIRSELLFNFRLPTGYENGSLEMIKESLHINNPKLAGLTGGPNLKLGIGYRF